MNIGVFDLSEVERETLEKLLSKRGISAAFHPGQYEPSDYEIIAVFVDSHIDAAVIDKSPNLKHIITMSTGFDHIDLEKCKMRGIKVYNIPDYGTCAVVEFTILLILASLRKFATILRETKDSMSIDYHKLRGRNLSGKTVGVIGTGRIGLRVAELCLSMGCKVLAYSRTKKSALELKGATYVDLPYLLKNSDIITLHTSLTPKTKHIINSENIGLLKDGALIINVSRGALIETKAILSRVHVLSAGLDVIEGESLLRKEMDLVWKEPSSNDIRNRLEADLLMKHNNVLITPHVAYDTEESIYRILVSTANTIDLILNGQKVPNQVRD